VRMRASPCKHAWGWSTMTRACKAGMCARVQTHKLVYVLLIPKAGSARPRRWRCGIAPWGWSMAGLSTWAGWQLGIRTGPWKDNLAAEESPERAAAWRHSFPARVLGWLPVRHLGCCCPRCFLKSVLGRLPGGLLPALLPEECPGQAAA